MTVDMHLPGGIVALSARAADKLIAAGDGDGVLLYLALLRHGSIEGAARGLGWSLPRMEAARGVLHTCGLAPEPSAVPPPASITPPEPSGPPEYLQADVAVALEGDPTFAALEAEIARRIGKVLSVTDLKTLYSLYDYLALPAEVILLVAAWCAEEEGRHGRPPRMVQIKKTAYRWHRMGVSTLDAAETYLQLQRMLGERERILCPALGIRGRAPMDEERKFIAAWVDWGFPDDAILLAYERTLMKKQSLDWKYMNSILRSWHGKNLHTVPEIRAGDGRGGMRQAGGPSTARQEETAQQDLEELRRILGK